MFYAAMIVILYVWMPPTAARHQAAQIDAVIAVTFVHIHSTQ